MRMKWFAIGGPLMLVVTGALVFHGYAKAPRTKSAAVEGAAAAAAQSAGSQSANIPVLYFAKDPEEAPAFQAQDLSGQAISLASLKGKVVLLNFWATWCGPCREEIPEMIKLQAQYKDTLQVIGASEDEGPPAAVEKFAQKFGMNYPVIMADDRLERAYGGVTALPTTFVINPEGRVVQKNVGVYPYEFYEMEVRSLSGIPVAARIETFRDTGQIFLKNAAHAMELPGVSFAGLSPAQKKIALHRLNAQNCTCGCNLTLAECRINDTTCPISSGLANKVVREVAQGRPPAATKAGTANNR